MGKVIDFLAYRQRTGANRGGADKPRDGIYLEADPPFIVFQHYEAGVLRQRLLSENLLREILDHL